MGETTAAGAPPRRLPPSRAARVHAVFLRHALVYGKSWISNATPAVFEPLLVLATVGLGVGRHVAVQFNGLPYDRYMAPGILATTAVFTAAYESTYGTFIRLRFRGTYDGMLATPLTVADVVLGELLWCASKGFVFTAIVGSVLAALGMVTEPTGFLIPVAGFCTALAFGGLGMVVTSCLRNINHLQVFFTAGLTPMVFLSGFMFPVGQLPAPVAAAARCLPMYHAVETFRLLATGTRHLSEPWTAWSPGILAVWAVVLGAAGAWRMQARILTR